MSAEALSLASGALGTIASVAGVVISILFYRRAKAAGRQTETLVVETLAVTTSSQKVLSATQATIAATQTSVDDAVVRLAEVLELHALELSSDTVDNFIEALVDRSKIRKEELTVGGVRKGLRSTRWTQTDGRQALHRLRGRLRFFGSLDDELTVIGAG
jgi:hypothetical protein